MNLQVLVEPTFPVVTPNVVSFETGATRVQTFDVENLVYEHHGKEFSPEHQGALTRFFEDVSLGRKLPTTFATHTIRDVDTILAMTLFLNRDLVLLPGMVALVAQVDMVHRRGVAMLGNLDDYMVGFIRLLRAYFPESLPRTEMQERIGTTSQWVRDYVTEGAFPSVGRALPDVTILDRGSGGFVVGETSGDLLEGWVVLFSQGYIRGVLVGPKKDGRCQVVATRKSVHVPLDVDKAAKLLNDVEAAMGEPATWKREGDWLFGPTGGTVLTLAHMLEVFLRV